MQRPRFFTLASLLFLCTLSAVTLAQGYAPMTSTAERLALHQSEEWRSIEAHLPPAATASAADLELEADVLRARRFPEDALDYYGYAMARGGKVSELLNKMGIVRLELRQIALAHEMFKRVVQAQKKNAPAWNNLGVTEFVAGNYGAAISDYKRAAGLNKHSATFRSNLGMAYFKKGDVESARAQFVAAMAINPHILQAQEEGGSEAHIVDSAGYPKLCFELARLFLAQQKLTEARLWLTKASDGGYDIQHGMEDDAALRPLLKDPEMMIVLSNAVQMRKRNVAAVKNLPSLGPAQNAN